MLLLCNDQVVRAAAQALGFEDDGAFAAAFSLRSAAGDVDVTDFSGVHLGSSSSSCSGSGSSSGLCCYLSGGAETEMDAPVTVSLRAAWRVLAFGASPSGPKLEAQHTPSFRRESTQPLPARRPHLDSNSPFAT